MKKIKNAPQYTMEWLAKTSYNTPMAGAHEIGHKLTSGKEYREVECLIEYDWKEKARRWIRKDTGEEAKQDIIPEDLLQEEMELQEKKGKEKGKKT